MSPFLAFLFGFDCGAGVVTFYVLWRDWQELKAERRGRG